MPKAKALLFLLLSAWSGAKPLFGQTLLVKETVQRNPMTHENYVFPKVVNAGASSIANKINNALRKDVLDADAGTAENKIFDNVWRTKEQSPTVTGLKYWR